MEYAYIGQVVADQHRGVWYSRKASGWELTKGGLTEGEVKGGYTNSCRKYNGNWPRGRSILHIDLHFGENYKANPNNGLNEDGKATGVAWMIMMEWNADWQLMDTISQRIAGRHAYKALQVHREEK